MTEERRRWERFHLVHYLIIYDNKTDLAVGNVVDITPAGIMLISEQPISSGTHLNLRMDFPEEIAGKRSLEFNARCVWTKRDINPDIYANGLQLIDVSSEDVDIIQALIEEFRDDSPP
jgi:hypothetical protein